MSFISLIRPIKNWRLLRKYKSCIAFIQQQKEDHCIYFLTTTRVHFIRYSVRIRSDVCTIEIVYVHPGFADETRIYNTLEKIIQDAGGVNVVWCIIQKDYYNDAIEKVLRELQFKTGRKVTQDKRNENIIGAYKSVNSKIINT